MKFSEKWSQEGYPKVRKKVSLYMIKDNGKCSILSKRKEQNKVTRKLLLKKLGKLK